MLLALNFYKKRKKMANDNHLFSVTLYNVTMINSKYYNEFFELGQQKINFNFFELVTVHGLTCIKTTDGID